MGEGNFTRKEGSDSAVLFDVTCERKKAKGEEERERQIEWNSRLELKRETEVADDVVGRSEKVKDESRMETEVGAFYGCAVRSRRRHDERVRDRSAREGPGRGARGSLSGSRIARLARTATATTGER